MKQSVYLSDTEHARWKALGVTLGGVIRAGLDAYEAAAKEMTAVARQQDKPTIPGVGILSAPARESFTMPPRMVQDGSDENR